MSKNLLSRKTNSTAFDWKIDGFCVPGIMLVPEDGTLHIDRITTEDEGLYTCEATNERGSVESSAYVSVESKSAEVVLLEFAVSCKCCSLYCKSAHLPHPVR